MGDVWNWITTMSDGRLLYLRWRTLGFCYQIVPFLHTLRPTVKVCRNCRCNISVVLTLFMEAACIGNWELYLPEMLLSLFKDPSWVRSMFVASPTDMTAWWACSELTELRANLWLCLSFNCSSRHKNIDLYTSTEYEGLMFFVWRVYEYLLHNLFWIRLFCIVAISTTKCNCKFMWRRYKELLIAFENISRSEQVCLVHRLF
jgi:hypothetical protein